MREGEEGRREEWGRGGGGRGGRAEEVGGEERGEAQDYPQLQRRHPYQVPRAALRAACPRPRNSQGKD